MDTSHLQPSHTLVNIAIGAVLGILFLKLLPYCSILFMEVCQKLKTLIASRSPTPNEPPNTREDPSSSESVTGEYDVFLSFHGEDTRNTFVCHLYDKLNSKGIRTFRDDKRLEKGKSISPSLIEAIEKSKISIVVFSPNYASSSWCLDELLKIVECMETKEQLVLPVFVSVDPTDVEKQRGTFANAFMKHQFSFVRRDRIRKWRDALSQISTIVGWDSRKCSDGNQAELIQLIAGEVSKSLNCKESSLETSLVGIDSHMMHIDEKLDLKCPDVRMLGIWGPGGIGKTTIAEFIYHNYSSRYEASCFLRDIKDRYQQNDGAIALQKDLIFDTLSERDLIIRNENEGCNFIRRLQSKKVLIVLDDVDNKEQLEVLAKKVEWFGPGSRIIITTRDRRLLDEHDVENIYEVQFLEKDKALQLFSLHAFKKNEPPKDFLELSDRFVSFTQCLPLALKVLGSSLYKREMGFWQDQFDKLKKYPNDKIYQSLKISYDGLEEFVKEVFLDVAFFFVGDAKAEVEEILHQCEFHPQTALAILEERSLLTISFDEFSNYERIHMHDLIKMMGHEIVREESKKDPSKRSRLCDWNEIKDVLTKEMVGNSMEGMFLSFSEESMSLKPNAFEKMNRLRILKFICAKNIHFLEGLGSLPTELRYFCWNYFPLKSLPFTSLRENLVELILRESKLEYLWEREMEFRKLKKIDLSRSKNLKAFPNLSRVPNIEEIILEGCENCYEFLSDLKHLQKLKVLNLKYCRRFDKLPMLPASLVRFFLSNSPITELSPGFKFLTKLQQLSISYCKNLTEGLDSFPTELIGFHWYDFPLKSLPFTSFGENLVELILRESKLEYLWEGEMEFRRLKVIDLSWSENLKAFPNLSRVPNIEEIILEGCENCYEFLSDLEHLQKLKVLNLEYCGRLDKLPMLLASIVRFFLFGSPITELSLGFKFLTKLQKLSIRYCRNLTEGLDSLPTELIDFRWDDFPLKSLPSTFSREDLVELILKRSKLEYLWEGEMEFRRLKKIDLSESENLKAFPSLSRVPNIEEINLKRCTNCCEFPSDIRDLQKLKILNLEFCCKLDKLPTRPWSLVEFVLSDSPITELSPGFKFLTNLKTLKLSDCRKLTLTEFQCIGELKSLKGLDMREAPFAELPQIIEHLHELGSLYLSRCRNLVRLPNCMRRLVSLQHIHIDHCSSLVSLPKLPPLLRRLNAEYCESLEFLKCNNWNCFRQLEYLNFMGCNKLFERSRKEIMECARVMSHKHRENEFYYRDEQISYFVPRTKILKWFEYKNCESSITIKIPRSSHQKIRGFVFCAAVMDDSRLSSINVINDLINLESTVTYRYSSSRLGDHVVIWDYHFTDAGKKVLTEYIGCELQFNIYCTAVFVRRSFIISRDVLVKEWGVHMIPDEEGLAK